MEDLATVKDLIKKHSVLNNSASIIDLNQPGNNIKALSLKKLKRLFKTLYEYKVLFYPQRVFTRIDIHYEMFQQNITTGKVVIIYIGKQKDTASNGVGAPRLYPSNTD